MIPYCNAHGIGLIPWGPLQAGDLAHPVAESTTRKDSLKGTPRERKYSEADQAIIGRVEEIAKKRGWKMSEVALAWVATKVSSPIVGCSSVSRVFSHRSTLRLKIWISA
jgi:aryl-alcohol dehydrogenase-like predicted oxidoreductase